MDRVIPGLDVRTEGMDTSVDHVHLDSLETVPVTVSNFYNTLLEAFHTCISTLASLETKTFPHFQFEQSYSQTNGMCVFRSHTLV